MSQARGVLPPMVEMWWTCMVCGSERPDLAVSVRHRPISGLQHLFPQARWNVRYCNDRPSCTNVAIEDGVWPAALPVLRADDEVRLSAAAVTERVWASRWRQLPQVAVGVVTWLHTEPATIVALTAAYDAPQDTIVEVCRGLIAAGLVEVAVDRCDPGRHVHATPHRGCSPRN